MIRRRAGLAMIVVLTLAVGIGAATRIFTFVNGIVLDSLPYTNPGRLVAVASRLVTVTERGSLERQQSPAMHVHALPCTGTSEMASEHGLRRSKGKSSS